MRHWWWKVLGALLLLFVVIVGLRTPLAPALVFRSIDRIAPGPATFTVQGYNTRFSKGAQAWLENDSQRVCATKAEASNDRELQLTFDVPQGLRAEFTDLHVFSDGDQLDDPQAFFTEGRGAGIASGACGPGKTLDLQMRFEFPNRNILNESIRNLFFHVPMWFTMVVLMGISVWKSTRYLSKGDLRDDRATLSAVQTGLFFTTLGLITGSLWARVTWGTWWTTDVKLNGAAVGALIYLAYLVLRGSVPDAHKRARLAAIYNIFAFCFLILFIFIVPRLNAVDSLHPGNGGNPAFNTYDLDNRLRLLFYPACAGWIILGVWMYTLRFRLLNLEHHLADENDR